MTSAVLKTMSGQITTHLRERILTGAYAPGSALLQDSIAAEFGVSKIPVREALVQLSAEGLVDVFAHRGFQVRRVSEEEVEEVHRLRLQIEPLAVAEGCRRAEAPDRAFAAASLKAVNEAFGSKDFALASTLNARFHLALIVPRLQPVAADVLTRLHSLARRYVHINLPGAARVKRAIREHSELHEAWAAGKSKEAARLTLAHIEQTREELVGEFVERAAEAQQAARAGGVEQK